MKLAVTLWNGRVAPVFDCSSTAFLYDTAQERVVATLDLRGLGIDARAQALRDLVVGELICGAISQDAASRLRAAGIVCHSFASGSFEEVLAAWKRGGLHEMSMPGCRCTRHRRRAGCKGVGGV